MEENLKNRKSPIDFHQIIKTLWKKKRTFLKVWGITFVLSCVWIFPRPRYYTTEVSLAPESADSKEMGNLASLASSFGVNIGGASSDAIYPQLYPDLFKSTNFLVGLLDIKVETKDKSINTDYYTYLKDHQKQNILFLPLYKLIDGIRSLSKKEEVEISGKDGKRFDPFQLSKKTDEIVAQMRQNIKCTYSRTTDVVTIKVTDQDPMVCALLADSIKEHLQVFITDYRTKKARVDYEHYKKLAVDAKAAYERARNIYASFSDASTSVALKSVELKIESMENEMQAKYNIYIAMNTRLEAAMAKVQERTPVFTELKNATVPTKPAGPKRMFFVAAMLFLATIGTTIHIFRSQLKKWF